MHRRAQSPRAVVHLPLTEERNAGCCCRRTTLRAPPTRDFRVSRHASDGASLRSLLHLAIAAIASNLGFVTSCASAGDDDTLGNDNPYARPVSVTQCAHGVRERCKGCIDGGSCDDEPSLLDEVDAKSECEFLIEQYRRADQFCVVALTDIASIRECVSGCLNVPERRNRASLEIAAAFLGDEECAQKLDRCTAAADEPLVESRDLGGGCGGSYGPGGCSGGMGGGCSGGGTVGGAR